MYTCQVCDHEIRLRLSTDLSVEGISAYEHLVVCFARLKGLYAKEAPFGADVALGCVALSRNAGSMLFFTQRLSGLWKITNNDGMILLDRVDLGQVKSFIDKVFRS